MYYNTETFIIDSSHYCAYCGKKALVDTEYDEYTPYYHHYCDCEKAQIEIKMLKEIDQIRRKYVGKLRKLSNLEKRNIEYQHHLFLLKLKYNKL